MNLPVNLLPRPRPDFFPLDSRSRVISRCVSMATLLTPTAKVVVPLVPAGQVLVITRILATFTSRATNTLADQLIIRITDGTNARNLPIAVHAVAASTRNKKTLDLRPGRSFVLGAGERLDMLTTENGSGGTADFACSPQVFGYYLSREEARTLGVEPTVWNGTAYTGNGFVAGFHAASTSRTIIVPAKTGLSIEIDWVFITGSAVDSTNAQNVLLEFSDAGSNHHKVLRHYNKSFTETAVINYVQDLQAGDIGINGPYSYNLSATNSKNSSFSVIVAGRYVGKHNTCDPTGVHTGPIAATGKKFWSYHESTDANNKQLFAATPGCMAHVTGACLSVNKTSGTTIPAAIAVASGSTVTSDVVGPAVYAFTADTVLASDLDLPLALTGTTSNNVHILHSHLTDGGASFAGTVWGRLRPSAELTMNAPATGVGITPLERIYKAIT